MNQTSRVRSSRHCVLLLCGSLLLIPAGTASAESLITETRALDDFHAVEVAISGDIRLQRGDEPALVIEARKDTLERLTTVVEDGVLRIHQKSGSGWWRNSGPVRIQVSYRQLDALGLSGSADVKTDALTADEFRVRISGSSNVRVPVMTVDRMRVEVSGSGDLEVDRFDADRLEIEVSGSGDVSFSGRVWEQIAVVRGSGTVDNARLETSMAEVTVSGSGNVDVWVTGSLEARISGSGDIEYRGEAEVSSQVTGSGDLRKR